MFYRDISSPIYDRRNRHEVAEMTTSPLCLAPLALPPSSHKPASKLCSLFVDGEVQLVHACTGCGRTWVVDGSSVSTRKGNGVQEEELQLRCIDSGVNKDGGNESR
jgi:hypothetical protein